MKTGMIALFLTLVIIQGNIKAQDTLILSVDRLLNEKVILHNSRNHGFRNEDTLKMQSSEWFFKINNPNHLNFKVNFQNNAPFAMKSITDLNSIYHVANNRLEISSTQSIDLGPSFSITIVNGGNTLRKYDLTYLNNTGAVIIAGNSDTLKKKSLKDDIEMGIIYYDALFLNDPAADPEKKLMVLAHHANTTIAGLNAALEKNRFLYPQYREWSAQRKPGAQNLLSLASASMSSIGGLDVTSIADGLSRFIVRRAKTEMNIAFFDRFRKAISDSSFRDLQTIFPNTYVSLNMIGDQIYNYELYLQMLRESFESDLRSLPENLPGIVENHPVFFAKYPELLASINSAFYFADGLLNRVHPGEILANYPVSFLDDEKLVNWKGSMQTLQLLSESLRNRAGEPTYWVSEKQVRELVMDKEALKIFIGLTRQHAVNAPYDSIHFAGNENLVRIIDQLDPADFDSWYVPYRNYITGFAAKARQVNTLIADWPEKASDSLSISQYYRFFNASIDLIEQCSNIVTLPGLESLKIKSDMGIYFEASRTASNLALDVTRRNYASAIINAVHIYDIMLVKHDKSPEPNGFAGNAEQKINTGKTYDFLFKYGSFMATVVQAKTSDDVANAIEAAALPSGSSRVKRETSFNVALNAYVGLYAGYEQIQGFDTTGFTLNTYGVTAPVGIAISRGHSVFFFGTGKSGWSTSVFISLIDIGAVASFRFKDDSTAQVPTIHLQDIISPGLFLSIGIPKCPVSVNFGAQMGPNLRKVTSMANDYSNHVYFRYSLSVVVDIPIFNFYSKSK